MKVVLVSNFFNHHQQPFADAMFRLLGNNFVFIETEEVPPERIALGYSVFSQDEFSYLFKAYASNENRERSYELLLNADFCIIGSCPIEYPNLLKKHKKKFFYESERFYKGEIPKFILALKRVKHWLLFGIYKKSFMLCLSAYTYEDAASFHGFKDRAFKFGYFPPLSNSHSLEKLAKGGKLKILWAGRLLTCKHPEFMVALANDLCAKDVDFVIKIVGDGPEKSRLEKQIAEFGLENCVQMLGALPRQLVRKEMEDAQYFCFTSDSNEGWGAVLNEALNAGCLVVANREIGSVPFLLRDGENGFVYDSTLESFLKTFDKAVLSMKKKSIGENAIQTIENVWNGQVAAERFVNICHAIEQKIDYRSLYTDGPMSMASK